MENQSFKAYLRDLKSQDRRKKELTKLFNNDIDKFIMEIVHLEFKVGELSRQNFRLQQKLMSKEEKRNIEEYAFLKITLQMAKAALADAKKYNNGAEIDYYSEIIKRNRQRMAKIKERG